MLPSSNEFNYTPTFNGILKQARATGYNTTYAVQELTDNLLSKQSKVGKVVLFKDEKTKKLNAVAVEDDGVGMTSAGLKEFFVIAGSEKNDRDETDIGSFRCGAKYAAMNLGNKLTVVSKVLGGNIVGLHANFDVMVKQNSFTPTDFCPSVVSEWADKYIPARLYETFSKKESGTFIYITELLSKCSNPIDKVFEDLNKDLNIAYTGVYNQCQLFLEEYGVKTIEINLCDLFYSSGEDLEHPAYLSELLMFENKDTEEVMVVEKVTSQRTFKKKPKGKLSASKPVYFVHSARPRGKGGNFNTMEEISGLPSHPFTQVGVMQCRVIQVCREKFEEEKEIFPERSQFANDRKGVYFDRDIRRVGTAKRLGTKFHDRGELGGGDERRRMQVKFPNSCDKFIGTKFNKQLDDKELPCLALNDAIITIYKQVTTMWRAHDTNEGVSVMQEQVPDNETFEENVVTTPEPLEQDDVPVKQFSMSNEIYREEFTVQPILPIEEIYSTWNHKFSENDFDLANKLPDAEERKVEILALLE